MTLAIPVRFVWGLAWPVFPIWSVWAASTASTSTPHTAVLSLAPTDTTEISTPSLVRPASRPVSPATSTLVPSAKPVWLPTTSTIRNVWPFVRLDFTQMSIWASVFPVTLLVQPAKVLQPNVWAANSGHIFLIAAVSVSVQCFIFHRR